MMYARPKIPSRILKARRFDLPIRRKNFKSSKFVKSPVSQILYLQRTIGNQAAKNMLKSGVVQAKHRIGRPGVIYKKDAKRVQTQPLNVQRQREGQLDKEYNAQLLTDEQLAMADADVLQKELATIKKRIEELSLIDPGSPDFVKFINYQSKILDMLVPVVDRPPPLSENEKEKLKEDIRLYISMAYTAFVSACQDAKRKKLVKDLAQGDNAGLDLLFSIAIGPLALAGSRKLGRLVKGSIPKRVTIYPKPKLPTGLWPEDERIKKSYSRLVTVLKDESLTKELFKSVSIVGWEIVQSKAQAISGADTIDSFIKELETATYMAFTAIGTTLDNISEKELIATWAAFHPENRNPKTYAKEIDDIVRRFEKQVKPIGLPKISLAHYPKFYQVVWINFGKGRNKLALVYVKTYRKGTSLNNTYKLIEPISPDMENLAIAKEKRFRGDLFTVPAEFVIGVESLK